MKMEAKAEHMTPMEIYKGVKELSDGELVSQQLNYVTYLYA